MSDIKNLPKVEVYDIETFKSCFTYTGIDIYSGKVTQFVIHEEYEYSNVIELFQHLKTLKGQIGFNNLNFDYPILHEFLIKFNKIKQLSPKDIAINLYNKAVEITSNQSYGSFYKTVSIPLKVVLIPQLDLFKIWHFNNKARSTSLKALQIALKLDDVMDNPIDFRRDDISKQEVVEILKYNYNDVYSTLIFYNNSLEKINLRKSFQKKYNIPCINFPDSKIGEELVLKLYCEKLNLDPYDIKQIKTERAVIAVKDCIFDYIKFESNEFNNLLTKLNSYNIITENKKDIEISIIFKGFKYDYGKGGIHGSIKAGIYKSDEEYIIIDADVTSLYPNIAIKNNLYPEHLGEIFTIVYENDIVIPRTLAKKEGDNTTASGLKLAANSVYGKSNDDHSFLKDPLYTYKTTINGQLLLSMLAEKLVLNIEDLKMLQINTDGLTVMIKKTDIEKYYELCKEWENISKLSLEFIEYKMMVIRDVNNYFALSIKDKIKSKGCFKTTEEKWKDEEYHKDFSFNIVAIALQQYFINKTPIETTLKNHTDILDFCGRQKFGEDSYGEIKTVIGNDVYITKVSKNVRYYISNKGDLFIKRYTKGAAEIINKGYFVTLFNRKISYSNFKDYDINYKFYIMECKKIINVIEDYQLKLF